MTIYTGEQAKDLMKKVEGANTPEGIYDYDTDNGHVLIDKDTRECCYMQKARPSRSGGAAIVIRGTITEFKELLKTFDKYTIKEMINFAEEEF